MARCTDAYLALVADHGRRAATQWDADRRREADERAAGLARRPHEVARKLEATLQGCELMLQWWAGLSGSLVGHGAWTDAQRSLALDLLGVRRELRDAATPSSTRPRATSSKPAGFIVASKINRSADGPQTARWPSGTRPSGL